MKTKPVIFNKQDLFRNYDAILAKSGLNKQHIQQFITQKIQPRDFLIQASSGRGGKVIYIPRHLTDIQNVVERMLQPYQDYYQHPPQRIALIGGISHAEVTRAFSIGKIEFRLLSLNDYSQLREFSPDIIMCYPSILRELMANQYLNPQQIKGIKLGGEPLFPDDLEKIHAYFSEVIILEQFGSTEMPAVAARVFKPGEKTASFYLQPQRFEYYLDFSQSGWQRLIVKDHFQQLLFPIEEFFDLGDEVYLENGIVTQVRSANDAFFQDRHTINQLYQQGCVNLQLDLKADKLCYQGDIINNDTIQLGKREFFPSKETLVRLPSSNKLPLLRP
ncbi:MAG: hypothetical protein KIT27_07310 [Legionellales bacterium]|nr:hypothetical protein [Legionellales bacterium]